MHHNVTGEEPSHEHPTGIPFTYESGFKDYFAVFFYTLICIIMHAVLQEYVLDVSIFNNRMLGMGTRKPCQLVVSLLSVRVKFDFFLKTCWVFVFAREMWEIINKIDVALGGFLGINDELLNEKY